MLFTAFWVPRHAGNPYRYGFKHGGVLCIWGLSRDAIVHWRNVYKEIYLADSSSGGTSNGNGRNVYIKISWAVTPSEERLYKIYPAGRVRGPFPEPYCSSLTSQHRVLMLRYAIVH